MEAEEIITLFDSVWFSAEIFKAQPTPQRLSACEENPRIQIQHNKARSELSAAPLELHSSPSSEQLMTSGRSLSPDSVHSSPPQQTALSERELTEEEEEVKNSKIKGQSMSKRRRRRLKKIRTKSLSELEFEEVKGFMDLGFVFSEEDMNSRLVKIIPGLHRMEKKEGEEEEEWEVEGSEDESVQRPYLSEAWEDLERRKRENLLMEWRMPGFTNEIGMKSNLKKWAHTVAATIK